MKDGKYVAGGKDSKHKVVCDVRCKKCDAVHEQAALYPSRSSNPQYACPKSNKPTLKKDNGVPTAKMFAVLVKKTGEVVRGGLPSYAKALEALKEADEASVFA